MAARMPSSSLRDAGSDIVKSAVSFEAGWQQPSGAEEHGEQRAHLRQVLTKRLHPDVPAVVALELHDHPLTRRPISPPRSTRAARGSNPRNFRCASTVSTAEQTSTTNAMRKRQRVSSHDLCPEHVTPPR